MRTGSVAVGSVGMVSPVGLNARASCAAIRARINRFEEIRVRDRMMEWIVGSPASETAGDREGVQRLTVMLGAALGECWEQCSDEASRARSVPLLLAIGDSDRPDLDDEVPGQLLAGASRAIPMPLSGESKVLREGKTGFFSALDYAARLLEVSDAEGCLVAGVDSFLNPVALKWLEWHDRLKTSSNSDGVVPGEGAAAVWVTRQERADRKMLRILGLGFGEERSVLEKDEPNLAEGLADAIRSALSDASMTMSEVAFRVGGVTGERLEFMEASTALARIQRVHRDQFQYWLPAETLGDVGAALPACMMVVAAIALAKAYAPGPTALLDISSDVRRYPSASQYRIIPNPYPPSFDAIAAKTNTASNRISRRAACIVASANG